ncbi:MAG: hypothetical protein NVS3B10_10540 [Polyangiales bacterium]
MLALLGVVAVSRSASAHSGVVSSEYATTPPTFGCSKGGACHTSSGDDVPLVKLALNGSSGNPTSVGSIVYVDRNAVVMFKFTIATKPGSLEAMKGMNAYNAGGSAGTMIADDGNTTVSGAPPPPAGEITFTTPRVGDAVTYTFQWRSPDADCTDSTIRAWGNAVESLAAFNFNGASSDQIQLRTRCPLGTGCSTSLVCGSGSCADGVCCDRACGGQCESCAGSRGCTSTYRAPKYGTCNGSGPCAGSCNGSGPACAYPTGQCTPPSCASGSAIPAASCDGAGNCPSAAPIACAPYTCNPTATACNGGCALDADCSTGNYCAAGSCVAQKPNGAACSAKNQCTSGFCVDGVCCNAGCTEQCGACNLPGLAGACSPVTGPPVGGRAACATDGSGCGGACGGTALGACTYPTTSCRVATCASGVETLGASCDGAGRCPTTKVKSCSPGTCNAAGTACATTCATDSECAPGFWCQAGACVAKAPAGVSCGDQRECTTGNCVDFVCCNSACSGACEACDVTGRAGTCTPVPAGPPHGSRTCPAGPDGCAGTCNGTTSTCAIGACDAGADTATGADSALDDGGGDALDDGGGDGGDGGDGSAGDGPATVDSGARDGARGDGDTGVPNENGGCACRASGRAPAGDGGWAIGLGVAACAALLRRRRGRDT